VDDGCQRRAFRHHRVSGWGLVAVIVSAIAVCGTVAVLVALRLSGTDHLALKSSKTPTASASPLTAAPSAPQPPESGPDQSGPAVSGPPPVPAAAQDLAQMLAQSAGERAAVVSAVKDVSACGPGLAQDAQVFQRAAASRQQLLGQLGSLRDAAALPARMLQDLNGAWQASYQTDQDYAAWAQDESNSSSGCIPDDNADSSLLAAAGPNDRATADKKAFVILWNPIAAQYGLPSYQWSDL
jgi:hypothetical protein